jgi:hypothetical protein
MDKKDILIELQTKKSPGDSATTLSPSKGEAKASPYDPSKLWLGYFYQMLYVLQLCMN